MLLPLAWPLPIASFTATSPSTLTITITSTIAGPSGDSAGQLCDHLVVTAPAPLEHVRGMIGALHHVQRRTRQLPRRQSPQERKRSQLVARALQEEHRHADVREMIRAMRRGLPRGVQRESHEDD